MAISSVHSTDQVMTRRKRKDKKRNEYKRKDYQLEKRKISVVIWVSADLI